mmetsp:Transcript_24865/g.57689  ORF Transcript_24865/g.57689 Transcript_24865/m.57689 type:complete len:109 (+) Transcript_24865:1156-1482(+)
MNGDATLVKALKADKDACLLNFSLKESPAVYSLPVMLMRVHFLILLAELGGIKIDRLTGSSVVIVRAARALQFIMMLIHSLQWSASKLIALPSCTAWFGRVTPFKFVK